MFCANGRRDRKSSWVRKNPAIAREVTEGTMTDHQYHHRQQHQHHRIIYRNVFLEYTKRRPRSFAEWNY
jgi:hypothetical protein